MSVLNYESEAKRIIRLLESKFTLPGGALSRERVEGKLIPEHLMPDLGDVVPFLIYFGAHDLARKQVNAFKSTLQEGLLISQAPSLGISGLVKSYEYTDLLFGLLDYGGISDEKDWVRDEIDKAINLFMLDRNLGSFYQPYLHWNLPIIDTRDSTFIEVMLDAEEFFQDKKYRNVARNIYENFIRIPFYEKHELFSTLALNKFASVPFWKFSQVKVCKNNTNTLYGWLALFEVTKDEDILRSIKDLLLRVIKEPLTLTDAFPLIDFAADLYVSTRWQTALDIAEEIALRWIGKQGKTGLFPLKFDGRASFFDSETDMCVALEKLAEITGKDRYREASEKCFSGIWDYHRTQNYILSVNIDTGDPIKNVQRTKFLTLFMKLLMLKIEQSKGAKIYLDRRLWKLLRDR